MFNKRHTYTDTRTLKTMKDTPVMSKTVAGKTIELWRHEWWEGWYIEIDGREVDGTDSNNFDEVKAKFEAM